MPKSDKNEERAMQVYAALGIGFVCIIVGLPLWWRTTTVYRVELPYTEIAELASSKIKYHIDFTVVVLEDNIEKRSLSLLGEKLKGSLEDVGQVDKRLEVSYRGNLRQPYEEEKMAFQQSNTIQDLDKTLDNLKVVKETGKYNIVILPKTSKMMGNTKATIGLRRTAYVQMSEDLMTDLPLLLHIIRDMFVNEATMTKTFLSAKGAVHQEADKESMRSLRSNPKYEVTFTLLNPQPDILNVQWDIQKGIDAYLGQLMDTFKNYGDINVKSQYLHYTGFGVRPEKAQGGNGFALRVDQLPHIINPMEAHLSSHVSNHPNINFIVYIPSRDQTPLHIYEPNGKQSQTNSFLSPRWGGIVLYNVETPVNASLPAPVKIDMRSVMSVFSSQLRLLLGIHPQVSDKGVVVVDPQNAVVSGWEFDSWTRARSLENVATATATLRSLAQLLEQISNIVINDNIGLQVEKAVRSIKLAQTNLAQGKLKEAFFHSKDAILSSETAFFDPSLLELLYFPEDQKFAIYIPLFLPISIPVVMSVMQSIRWLMGKEKDKKE